MSHSVIASAFTSDKVAPIVSEHSLVETDTPPLVELLDTNVSDPGAAWAGYFWGGRTPAKPLYEHLEASIMGLIKGQTIKQQEHVEFLPMMLLYGWQRLRNTAAPQLTSDSQMQDTFLNGGGEFRAQVVWCLQRAWLGFVCAGTDH